ncbi:MAG: hypothetical protein QOI73_1292 [Solirubrobacteraceae bacterium]|nr:hypothetical protein [Solirubrobacteraceae bacterium]
MDPIVSLTRRRALAAGGAAVAGLALPAASPGLSAASARLHHRRGRLPAAAIQDIVGAEGSVSAGVLGIEVQRSDIGPVAGPLGVTFTPSFQIHGDLTFQPLGDKLAFFNGDLALKASELNAVVDAIHANGLVFQAMHQHYFDLQPMVWFVHFRGVGGPRTLARAVRRVLDVTSAPLPQTMPESPATPLDHGKLAKTLHGSGEVGADGVVTVVVARRDRIVIGDVQVSPEANISTNVEFLPLDAQGSRVAVAPDFSMTAAEVGPVCRRMRAAGFEIGCLYNQETAEHPQLYFAHMIAVGDPQHLAVKIREALNRTNSE